MPELGTKHECLECGARFYDLGKPEARCPRCGADQTKPKPEKKSDDAPEPAVIEVDEGELEEEALDDEALEELQDEEEDDELLDEDLLDED